LFSKKGGVFLFKKTVLYYKAINSLNSRKCIFFSMNKGNDRSLAFGWRKVQKVRHSYTVIIPKVLASALHLKEGDKVGFILTEDRQLVLQMEGIHSEAN
jgi:AbrB family looped-hinge helix DNA binding protein